MRLSDFLSTHSTVRTRLHSFISMYSLIAASTRRPNSISVAAGSKRWRGDRNDRASVWWGLIGPQPDARSDGRSTVSLNRSPVRPTPADERLIRIGPFPQSVSTAWSFAVRLVDRTRLNAFFLFQFPKQPGAAIAAEAGQAR